MSNLVAQNLYYTYRNKAQQNEVLKGINICFKPGKMYAIVGKSGSGKTTLLSLLAGLDSPSSGSVFYDAQDVYKMNTDNYRLNHVSMIYQNFNLLPLLTATENVMLPLEMKGISKNDALIVARERLFDVGLDQKTCGRYPSMLSGGEQQRIAIARALACESKIILADEPTGNLDTDNSYNIIKLLKELVRVGNCCAIVVTHDNTVAEQADEVLKLIDGRID